MSLNYLMNYCSSQITAWAEIHEGIGTTTYIQGVGEQ